MKYSVLQLITNTQGQYSAKISSTHDTLKSAKVSYFGVCQSMNNSLDVAMASIKIVDELGNDIGYNEFIDNTLITTTIEG